MYFNQAEFGRRAAELRSIKRMTQEDLAEKLGVSKKHISEIERGIAACSIDLLLDISTALNVSTDYLLTGKNSDKEIVRAQLIEVISQLSDIAQLLYVV